MTPDFWVILTGVLVAAACGLIGSFLVLRQQAMLGDGISHAILPGLAIAFLLSGTRQVLPMFLGAAAMGLVTAWLTEILSRTRRVYPDASLGIVFTLLFAVGVILIAMYADFVDLDQECVLYGEIAYVPWDSFMLGGQSLGPRAVWILGTVLFINLAFIALFFRQLTISSFDPPMATAVGINERFWHYALMTMISITIVAAFELVGAILVVAMLIMPGATAFLVTHRLSHMLALAVLFGALAALSGFGLASAVDSSISGSMAVTGGLLFGLVALLTRFMEALNRQRLRRQSKAVDQGLRSELSA